MVDDLSSAGRRRAGRAGRAAGRRGTRAARRDARRAAILAEVYYREVIARVLPVMRARLTLAVERGELPHDALARFPQLLVAPAFVAIIWNALFGRLAPLDVRGLMRAHLDVLFGARSAT